MEHTRRTSRIRYAAGALLAVLMLTAGAGGVLGAEPLNDAEVTDAVDDELIMDQAVPAGYIDAATVDGIVTLTGSVNNILAKDRAAKIAATVKGVRGVVNRIDVLAPYRSDVEIDEDVEDALLWDPVTESWEVDASVADGVVTLSGTVDSWQEKQLAAKVAKGVRGVKGIDNDLAVDYETDRTDTELQEEIADALHWDAYVDDALIDVSVNDGDVTLSGTVGSLAEKNRAYGEAWVAGVTSVSTDDLEVKYWARDERLRKDKYVTRTAQEIRDAVKDAFLYDPRVMSFKIDVDPDGGYVTLRGTVDNLKAKRAAAQDARSVVGVWSVNNKIKVRPGTPSDERIEDNVEAAMIRDPYVDRYELTVSVVDGEVYLYGDVDSTFEKSQADDVAARQVGVVDVNNFLTVNDPAELGYDPYTDDWYLYDYDWYDDTGRTTTKSDWEIEDDIESQLFWSPFVDSDEVNVDVEDGTAQLTGTVDTWSERAAATENALEGGAVVVDNDLMVDYGPDYYIP